MRLPTTAVIHEAECIGCTKCISACPVDAIIGTAKMMHAVLTHECIGCGLCIEPCPMDCIEMVVTSTPKYDLKQAKNRVLARKKRLLHEKQQKEDLYQQQRQLHSQNVPDTTGLADIKAKQDYILQALTRVKQKKYQAPINTLVK